MMKSRDVAGIIFYINSRKILMQDRRSIRKFGEEWGFFGGGLEPGETREQALVRELREELDYSLTGFSYLGQTEGVLTFSDTWNRSGDILIRAEWFIKQIPEDISSFTVLEGDGAALFALEEAKKLKITQVDKDAIALFETVLNSQ